LKIERPACANEVRGAAFRQLSAYRRIRAHSELLHSKIVELRAQILRVILSRRSAAKDLEISPV
jgi:hypothetical protein